MLRFVEEFIQTNLKWLAGGLFVCAMVALICGLALFLREVYLATRTERTDVARFGGWRNTSPPRDGHRL